MATKQSRLHGRVEGAQARCAVPGCAAPGEFKAPLQPANFDGPGAWRFLCLDHVREHNAKYNFFEGMSTDEISDAQSPLPAGSGRAAGSPPTAPTRRPDGATLPIRWMRSRARFGRIREPAKPSRFSKPERRALSVLGLGDDADRHALRQSYSGLVRRYHPDKNGGDRSHEARLGEVIEAYQLLRKSAAFA